MNLYEHIQDASAYLRQRSALRPRWGIIMGTGLGGLSTDMRIELAIPYAEIPHFPLSTVASHAGQLLFGELSGQPVVALSGRFHYYEGYTMQQVTFPVRVLAALGIERLLISNAAGSVQGHLLAGDVVFIKDHINLQPENPLRGPNDERLGPRFPDMLHAYDAALREKALAIAAELGVRAHEGVYAGLQGPNLETPAEYRFLHLIGADVVGMSTVPEVLVARHAGLPVLVASVVSNRCYPIEDIAATSVDDVIRVVRAAEPGLRAIVRRLLAET